MNTTKEKWHCGRCGGYANTRKERRMHSKCPAPPLERVQQALACQDPEWVKEIQEQAKLGNKEARFLLLQVPESNRDFALLQKQYNNEVARMAEKGMYLDGSPINPPEETQNEQETITQES